MEKPKSKGIFWVLSIIAVIFLVLLVSRWVVVFQ